MITRIIKLPSDNGKFYPWESFDVAYMKGYLASKHGRVIEDNPYVPPGHERNTTFDDMKNML